MGLDARGIELNFLKVRVEAVDAASIKVGSADLGTLVLPKANVDAKLGDEVTVGLRPHHLTIGGAKDMTGRVALVERLGNDTLAAIVLGSGQQIIAALPGDIDVAAGQELHLATQLDRASLFLADGVAA